MFVNVMYGEARIWTGMPFLAADFHTTPYSLWPFVVVWTISQPLHIALGFYRIVSTHSHFWLVRGYPSRSFPVLVDFPIKNFFLMALAKVRCVSPVSPQPHIIYRLFWTQPVWRERWFLALPTTELFSHNIISAKFRAYSWKRWLKAITPSVYNDNPDDASERQRANS